MTTKHPLPLLVMLLTTLLVGAGTSGDRETYEVVRTTPHAASFTLKADLHPLPGAVDMDAFAGSFAAETSSAGEVLQSLGVGGASIGHNNAPTVHAFGDEAGTCSTAGACSVSATFGASSFVTYADDGGAGVLNRFYFVFEGADVDIEFEGSGWELHAVPLDFRYVDYRHAEAVGVGLTGQQGADLFLSAFAEGGVHGSIAQGIPPCSTSVAPAVGRGIGTLTLSGGGEEHSVICPGIGRQAVVDHAEHAVTWRADGPIIGHNALMETRLFVIDLPPCNERVAGLTGPVDGVACSGHGGDH